MQRMLCHRRALTGASLAVAASGCSDVASSPTDLSTRTGLQLSSLNERISFPCKSARANPVGAVHKNRYSIIRFDYPQTAVHPNGRTVARSLIVTDAGGDTLSVTTCAVPATSVGLQLAQALFDNVATRSSARRTRADRADGSTMLQLSFTRLQRRKNPISRLDAPVCVSTTNCVSLTPSDSPVSLTIQYGPPPPPGDGPGGSNPCEYDGFYGCDFSNPNGGGGGGNSWDPDVFVGEPADTDLRFVCSPESQTCLKPLSNTEYVVIESAMMRFKPDDEMNEACRIAAMVARAHLASGFIYTGVSNHEFGNEHHLGLTGTDEKVGSRTYGMRVMHLEQDFMASVQGAFIVGNQDYDELDLANVLLHEAMHLVENGLRYNHPSTGPGSAPPFATGPFALVNPRTGGYLEGTTFSSGSRDCVQ